MNLIETTINSFLSQKINDQDSEKSGCIDIYFKNQMTSNYKQDEKQLRDVIEKTMAPSDPTEKVKLNIYYQNRKVRNLFIKNNVHNNSGDVAKRHHVVYQYSCVRDSCNTTIPMYIGYTTCSVSERFRMHTQNSSSIKKHLQEHHGINKTTTAELLTDVKILKNSSSKTDLIFYEALLIKSLKPSLNAQNEGCDRILKIFKH
jgi:hypothetical protein